MPNAVVTLQVQSQAAPQIAQTANAYKSLSAAEQQAETGAQRYALALNKVALADTRTATEEQRLAVQTANVAKAQSQAEGAALRLSNAQSKAASGSSYAAQTADAFKSGILGIVGPVAVATAALGILIGTANSFKEAFAFKAQLDQNTASIVVQLRGVRESGAVFASAAAFADRYKLTQQETTDAIRASLPVIRQSKATTEEILGTLARLRVLNPEQDFAGAARALGELKAGQITSIVDRFNIGRSSANAMKKEIEGGGDAVLVLSKYLDSAGIGMDALAAGASGASGALRDLVKAQEDLKIAQADFAQGPGLAILAEETRLTTGLTRVLGGAGGLAASFQAVSNASRDSDTYQLVYNQSIEGGATAAAADAAALAAVAQVSAAAAAATTQASGAYDAAAQAALYYADSLLRLGPAAASAASAIDALNNKKVLPHLTDTQNTGAVGGLGAALTKGGNLAAAAAKKTDAEAARLQSARDALALAKATTSAQKIAELKRQQSATTDPVEKLQLQTQIEQERNSAAKSHTGELNKQLNLHESIYDSMAKQRDAALDIEKLAITGRQADRADAQKVKTAQAILAKLVGRTDARAEDARARAQDVIALADVEHRQRANELAGKGATAGASIVNGKLIQSVPGGALPPPPGSTGVGALPLPPGAPGAAGGAGTSKVLTLRLVDGANRILAELTEPFLMDAIMRGLDQADVGIGR